VLLVGERDKAGGDARPNIEALLGPGGSVEALTDDLMPLREALAQAGLCVDALFGTGLTRPVAGRWLGVIEAINDADCPVVSLDLPSGLDADSGRVLGAAVRADLTITFGRYKLGLLQGASASHAGELRLVGLGIPDAGILAAVGCAASSIAPAQVRAALGERPADAHKYRAGKVVAVAGSAGKLGAALLCARGALRAGAGIATIASWPEAASSLAGRVEEVMTATIDPGDVASSIEAALARSSAVAIGPGLGLEPQAREVVERVVLGWPGPVVVDADAISHLAGRPEALRGAPGPRVLTPHAGELGRLLGISAAEVEENRYHAACRASEATGATVVLKGRHSWVASDGGQRVQVCMAGSSVLATAGAGDVLTGVVAALLCGAGAHSAASAAVHLHALAADLWRRDTHADRGMLAGDIAAGLPGAMASLMAG